MIALTLASPGDPVRVDLDEVRLQLSKARDALTELDVAPLPLEEAVERALAHLRARAGGGENSIAGFARKEGPAYTGAPRDARDVLALLFTVAPELVEKGLRAQLKTPCRNGVSLAEREARAGDLRGRLEKLLVREEELTIGLLFDDVTVERSVPETGEEIRRLLEVWDRLAA